MKSPYAAFQALQATAYHIVMILAALLAGTCYMCSIFVFPLGLPLSIAAIDPSGGEASPLLAFAFFLLMMSAPVPGCLTGRRLGGSLLRGGKAGHDPRRQRLSRRRKAT